jgi:hypothetical protein
MCVRVSVCFSLSLSLCALAHVLHYRLPNPELLEPKPYTLNPRPYYVQALQRGKNDRKPKGDTNPPASEGGGLGMFSMFQRCMTVENDLPPARE